MVSIRTRERLAAGAILVLIAAFVMAPLAILFDVAHQHRPLMSHELASVAASVVRGLLVAAVVAALASALAYPVARSVPVPIVAGLALTSPAVRAFGVLALGVRPGTLATALAMLAGALPLAALVVRLRLDHRPRVWLEAAADLGAGPWRRFRHIEWPHARPAFVVAFAWIAIQALGDAVVSSVAGGGKAYGPGLLARDALLRDLAPGRALLVSVVLIVIAGVLAGLVARDLGTRSAAVETARLPPDRELSRVGWWLAALCLVPGLALAPELARPVSPSSASLLSGLVGQTLLIASMVAVCASVIGFGLALALRRSRATALTTLLLVPLAVPASVSGALALATAQRLGVGPGDVLTTVALLPPAVALAFVVSRIQLRSVSARLAEAAADLGAGPWLRFRSVWWPVARVAVIVASLLVFAWVIGEAAIVAFTAGPGGSTLAIGLSVVAKTGDVGTVARWGISLAVVPVAVGVLLWKGRWR